MSEEAKVVSLRPGRVIHGQPHADIIDQLETYLDWAKRGEIDGIALAASRPNDVTSIVFEFGTSGHRLTAAVAMLHFDVMKHALDSSDD